MKKSTHAAMHYHANKEEHKQEIGRFKNFMDRAIYQVGIIIYG